MSKTFKDKANHFKHHLSHGEADVFYAKRNKLKYKQEDIPDDVKEMVKTLEYNGAGDRHGNHRKMLAKTKVTERRIERKRENREFQKRVNEEWKKFTLNWLIIVRKQLKI